jgi:hypothetical protein
MTDWVVQEDWYEVAVGDQVRVVRGDNVLDGKIVYRYQLGNAEVYAIGLLVDSISGSLRITNEVWTLFVPAKPAVVLPTEPGLYLSPVEGGPWVFQLSEYGDWKLINTNSPFPIGDGHLERNAPFTKLEPVAVTAKKVIEFIDAYPFTDALDAVRTEFGVSHG